MEVRPAPAQALTQDYHDCLRAHARNMVVGGDPRALRAAYAIRENAYAGVRTEDFRAVHAAGVRACRRRR